MHRNYSDEEDSDDEERKSAEEVESGSDSDEEELKQHLASIQLLKQSGFYQTKGFTDETLPTTVELYRGKINVLANDQIIVGNNCSTIDYDSMEAYQKALPGQGFVEIIKEIKGPDGPKLTCLLMAVFNKDDKMEKHRKHLDTLGIPYLVSEQARGGNTGILHIRAKLRFPKVGEEAESKSKIYNTFGLGIIKGQQLLGRSLSQNAHSVQYDEEFLLAYGLGGYDTETKEDTEFKYRRLLPPDLLLQHNTFLMKELKRFAEEKKNDRTHYPHLDNGQWLSETPQQFLFTQTEYVDMAEWPTLPRPQKNKYLYQTLINAIKYKDPPSYTDGVSFGKETSYITRILRLNEERNLKLDLNQDHDGFTLLMLAVLGNLPHVVNQLCDTKTSGENKPLVDVNLKSFADKETALHLACRISNLSMVEKLIERKASLDIKNIARQNPVDIALASMLNHKDKKNVEIFMRLINAGGKPTPLKLSKLSDLIDLHKTVKSDELAKCVLSLFPSADFFLKTAVYRNNVDAVRFILENKTEEKKSELTQLSLLGTQSKKSDAVNIQDTGKNTLLHHAIANKNASMVQLLLEHKADLTIRNSNTDDSLSIAIQVEEPNIVKMLLEHGATPDKAKLLKQLEKGQPSNNLQEIEKLINEAVKRNTPQDP